MPVLKLFNAALTSIDTQVKAAPTQLRTSPMAADQVSAAASCGFTAKGINDGDSGLATLSCYRDRLAEIVTALTAAAKEYGHTEQDITRLLIGSSK